MPADDLTEKLSCELPSSLTAYHDFVQVILDKLEALGWDKSVLFGIHMALEESISNAVRHGNKESPDKVVQVDCELSARRFWCQVCDQGEGYDPNKVPDCRSPENLERPGGRGLTLIEYYMTTVEHSDCGCCLRMEKLLDDADQLEDADQDDADQDDADQDDADQANSNG